MTITMSQSSLSTGYLRQIQRKGQEMFDIGKVSGIRIYMIICFTVDGFMASATYISLFCLSGLTV